MTPQPPTDRPGRPVVRVAGEGDVEPVLALWSMAATGASISDDVAGVRRLLATDPDALLVADDDGALVGTVIAGWDGWRCHLYRLAVAPSHRRRGVARALVAAAEARFERLGGRRVDAMVLDDNTAAHDAWTRLGYGPQPVWTRWVAPLPRPVGRRHTSA